MIGNKLYACPQTVKTHFENAKPGRPLKVPVVSDDLVEALLWVKDKDGHDFPTRPNLVLYSEGKLSDDDFDRLMAFCDREPDLADKIMEAIDDGKIWVPSPD
jgi:hypothetical protein